MQEQSTNKEANLYAKLLSKIEVRKKQSGPIFKKNGKVNGYDSNSSEGEPENIPQFLEIDFKGECEQTSDIEVEICSLNEATIPESPVNSLKTQQYKLLKNLKSKVEKRKKEIKEKQEVKNKIAENIGIKENQTIDHSKHIEDEIPKPMKRKDNEVVSNDNEFQILGKQIFEQRRKVRSVLPDWLAYPTIFNNNLTDTTTAVEGVSYICDQLKLNLKLAGIKHLFPVQSAVIPYILNTQEKPTPFWPRDICCSAPTGSGKTLAFALPIIQLLMSRMQRKVRALIILPVQELAEQVASVFKQISYGTNIVCALLSSTIQLSIEKARLVEKVNDQFYSKVDIVITTAGRLVEHLHSTEGFSLKDLRFLVIDEADRVMAQIQNDWLYHLNKHIKLENESLLLGHFMPLSVTSLRNCPRPPHKLLFSATLSQDPEKIQKFKLFHPKLFTAVAQKDLDIHGSLEMENGHKIIKTKHEIRGDFVGKYTTPTNLVERYTITEARLKPLSVYALLKENNWRRFLCFTNSTDASHRLSFVLQELFGDEMVIEELSSTLNIVARKNVLHKFANFKVNGLISTDALARGIDVPSVDVVISYDLPKHVKTYVHRIGRTARAGNAGVAITLIEKFQFKQLQQILQEAGKENVTEIKLVTGIEEKKALDYANTLKSLQKAIEKERNIIKRKVRGKASDGPKNLLDQIRQQINDDEAQYFQHHIPESWREENVKEQAEAQHKRMQKFLQKGGAEKLKTKFSKTKGNSRK